MKFDLGAVAVGCGAVSEKDYWMVRKPVAEMFEQPSGEVSSIIMCVQIDLSAGVWMYGRLCVCLCMCV